MLFGRGAEPEQVAVATCRSQSTRGLAAAARSRAPANRHRHTPGHPPRPPPPAHRTPQEPAQDPCGYGLLPAPPAVLLPLSASASSGSTPTGTSGSLLSPPCSSPELLDQHAPVGSGSSDGGGSQPGTASSRASSTGLLGGGFPLGPSPPAPAAPAVGSGDGGPQRGERGTDALPLPPQRVVQLVGGGFSASREPGSPWGAAAAAAPKLSPPPSRRSLLGALELPEGEVLNAVPSRSVLDEVDFIHLSLTPIRTRAASQEQGECSPPVAYADSLAPAPAPADACCGGGLAAKAAPGGRPTIHIIATSASLSAAPGAYNPYERSALAGGGGYGGGRSYGFNYGAAPTGPPTSSSGACYWASHQQRQHHGVPQQAAPLPGPAAEQGCWPAAATTAALTAVAAAVPKALAVPAAQPEPAAVEEVEHIVMVPGMRRKHNAPAPTPAPAAPAPASAAPRPCPLRGLAAAAAAHPATEEKGTWTSPAISALGEAGYGGVPRAEEHVHGSCAAASALAAGAVADGGRAAAAEGGNLLKQVGTGRVASCRAASCTSAARRSRSVLGTAAAQWGVLRAAFASPGPLAHSCSNCLPLCADAQGRADGGSCRGGSCGIWQSVTAVLDAWGMEYSPWTGRTLRVLPAAAGGTACHPAFEAGHAKFPSCSSRAILNARRPLALWALYRGSLCEELNALSSLTAFVGLQHRPAQSMAGQHVVRGMRPALEAVFSCMTFRELIFPNCSHHLAVCGLGALHFIAVPQVMLTALAVPQISSCVSLPSFFCAIHQRLG